MSERSALGVLIPTRNSAALLPGHLTALATWLDLADEVVVMDSFSTDGTTELLRNGLKHSNCRFLSHPPGLYASWNAGLQQLTTEYAYIATVGDTITRAGIEQLLEAARSLEAEVVLSKPTFQRPDGERVEVEWPIDDMIRSLQIVKPRRLERLEMVAFAAVHPTHALTGSCASNVFRTDVLKRCPFPTEFGTAGDGVWGLRQAASLRWAVVPGSFSTFLLHPTPLSQTENRPRPGAPRADAILHAAMVEWKRNQLITEAEFAQLKWTEMEAALAGYLTAKAEFDQLRRDRWPWIIHPTGWSTRARRNRLSARLQCLKGQALHSVEANVQKGRLETRSGHPKALPGRCPVR